MGYGVVPVGGDSLPISLTSVTLNPSGPKRSRNGSPLPRPQRRRPSAESHSRRALGDDDRVTAGDGAGDADRSFKLRFSPYRYCAF